jgi:hypothetical protein
MNNNNIMQRITENKNKEVGCQFHEFVIDKFAGKYSCKNCSTTQPTEFILGYARGLQHAIDHPDIAKTYLDEYFDKKT